ncbi:Fic family protein [Anoxynatronum sibiricum]
MGVKDSSDFTKRFLDPLIKGGLLKRTLPNKPTSPNQKYYSER